MVDKGSDHAQKHTQGQGKYGRLLAAPEATFRVWCGPAQIAPERMLTALAVNL
jgi:hypothetical protein